MPRMLWCTAPLKIGQQSSSLARNIRTLVLNIALSVIISKWDWNVGSDQSVITICTQVPPVHLNIDNMWLYAMTLPRKCKLGPLCCHLYSILPQQSHWQMGLANMLCCICQNTTQDMTWGFTHASKLRSYARKFCRFATNQPACFLISGHLYSILPRLTSLPYGFGIYAVLNLL